MTPPEQFINHWKDNPCFERGAKKDGGGEGWADVWKRDCFGWENKKPGRDLNKALAQLREYAGNLGNLRHY